MRLLLRLEATRNCAYDLMYYHKLQGVIYNLLRNTEYQSLHNKKGYKFFCFSNIFPIADMKAGDKRYLLISSPNNLFIKFLENKLNELIEPNEPINIGDVQVKLNSISIIKTKLRANCNIISATPVVIRIPERNYDKYGIEDKFRKKTYVYWRAKIAFEAFIKQLEENLFKKYNEYYKKKIEEFSLFEQFVFKKETANSVITDGREHVFIGSIWKFKFNYLNEKQRELLEFGVDCGFGERNSLGFGFMNVV